MLPTLLYCTSSWASIVPYYWDVCDVVGSCHSNVWDAMTLEDSSTVAHISFFFFINIFLKVKEICDVFHDRLVSKLFCNKRKKTPSGTILKLKWLYKTKNGNVLHIMNNTQIDGNILHLKNLKG
jgi:hypothetical protein